MKKAFAKKKMPHATFMYIPDDETSVKSFRIPLWLPIAFTFIVVAGIIFTYISTNTLSALKAEHIESSKKIQELDKINTSQKQKIEGLEKSTSGVKTQLEENAKLLDEVKSAVGLKDAKK